MRIVTLPFDPELSSFDDEPVRGFLADKELLEMRDHFFVYQGKPHLAVVLIYRPETIATPKPGGKDEASDRRDSWRDLLERGDWPLFNTLREWRGQRAKEEGFPPYVICTNKQLAELVHARPQTLSKLGEIEGFGKAKLKKYGKEILSYLKSADREEPADHPLTEETNEDDRNG